jgi:hypothetical protein
MNKRIPMTLAASVLASVGVAGLAAGPASAGCGVTVEVHNQRSSTITVDWEDSDSRSDLNPFGGIVAGTWKRLLNNTTNTILPGDTESRAIVLDLACNVDRQYRLEISQGGSSWFVYSGWADDPTEHVDVF